MNLISRSLRSTFSIAAIALLFAGLAPLRTRADSTVVFNEIMYHPATNEAVLEWVELHNQMAVDMDLSGWSISDGVSFVFPEGTILAGGGYLVVASSPTELAAATGYAQALGPFTGRLNNSGERLELKNHNGRWMDRVTYGVAGDWPVAPDGGGVSLAKKQPHLGSSSAESWAPSAQMGGTPGLDNFPAKPNQTVVASLINREDTWRYSDGDTAPPADWTRAGFNDGTWSTGRGIFAAGGPLIRLEGRTKIPTVFSTGVGADGKVANPATRDPHFQILKSAHNITPKPPVAALVIQNHPAWLANSTNSSWISVANPGTLNIAAGAYAYQTAFDLRGFFTDSVELDLRVAADDRLTNVVLNGSPLNISRVGFADLSPSFLLRSGFEEGTNTLEFQAVNDGTGANPGGFRAELVATGIATAGEPAPIGTTLPPETRTYYFRKHFAFSGVTSNTLLRLRLLADDGVIVYLNQTEVLRQNLPGGPVNSRTPALSEVAYGVMSPVISLSGDSLVKGDNVLAVELHQANGVVRDAAFALELSVDETILPPPPVKIGFNEVVGAGSPLFWFELINHGETSIDLSNYHVILRGDTDTEFGIRPGTTIAPGGLLAFSQEELGFKPKANDRLFLLDPERRGVRDAVVVRAEARGRYPDGVGDWLRPSELTQGTSNRFRFNTEVVINEILYKHRPELATPAVYGPNQPLVSASNQVWRFHQEGIDLGTAWRAPGYEDGAWPQEASLYFFTPSNFPPPKVGPLRLTNAVGQRVSTWYFRTHFQFSGEPSLTRLTLVPIVDDGAVFYLNGVEFFRTNLPASAVSYSTRATRTVGTATFGPALAFFPTNLLSGDNVVSVEVHRISDTDTDVAFAMDLLAAPQLAPGKPYRENPEQWLELLNRGSNTVDLTGWRLDGGVDYRFEEGLRIGPGGYLVVAKDPAALRILHPGVAITGPYTNQLSASGERVVLKDASDNPADSVFYRDEGRWPEHADAGGSSLELMDPFADNAAGEAWAASDESGRSEWRTITYRGMGSTEAASSPTAYREFILGLITAGEVWIDDISVIETPATNPKQLITNGSFENGSTGWRFLGTHRYSRVETDPVNPANRVLRLVAVGATEHMHNHAEITLAQNAVISPTKEYEISCRARWIAGSGQLNSRLYFNRLARTTVLERPEVSGTPGRRNSRAVANLGPTFDALRHAPSVPAPDQPIRFSVRSTDPQGVASVTLWMSTNGAPWVSFPMTLVPGSAADYQIQVAPLGAGALAQFYVEATDTRGASAVFPAGGRDSRAMLTVKDGQGPSTPIHSLRILMTAADAAFQGNSTNVMSNERMKCTLVYDESEVFYDAGVHFQGSERGRDNPDRRGFTVYFPPDHLFRGVHSSVSMDRSGGISGLGGRHDEIVVKHALNKAGGIPGMYDDLVYCIAPRRGESSTALLIMAKYNEVFLDSQYDNGAEGSLFKLELIYYPTTTVPANNPQGFKLPQPDEVLGTDITFLGEDKEAYRWNFLHENNAERDDYSGIIALGKAFAAPAATQDALSQSAMDVDEWMRTFAFLMLSGTRDTYSYDNPHNFIIYIRPSDHRALAFLWDMDFCFNAGATDITAGTASTGLSRLMGLPAYRRAFVGHALDIVDRSFNSAYMTRWVNHYSGLLGQSWAGVNTYISQKAAAVRGGFGAVKPFVITNNAGQNFVVNSASVNLGGDAWYTIRRLERKDAAPAATFTWPNPTRWISPTPLEFGTNLIQFLGYDFGGKLIASNQIVVTSTDVTAGLDSDGDGIADRWESANGLNPRVADADLDPDRDGISNREEYLSGTNPQSANSALRLGVGRVGSELTLMYEAQPGRGYSLQRRASATEGVWETIATTTPVLTNRLVTATAVATDANAQFYRLITPAQ